MNPDLWYVPGLEEVGGLKDLLVNDPVLLDRRQEGLDVLHQQEGGALEQYTFSKGPWNNRKSACCHCFPFSPTLIAVL